jgi:hypothetical protein
MDKKQTTFIISNLLNIVDDLYKMTKSGRVDMISTGQGLQILLKFDENLPHQSFYDSYSNPLKSRIDSLKMMISPPLNSRDEKINKLNESFLEDRVEELQNEVEQLKNLIKQYLPQVDTITQQQ